jgi:hypothetical protein
MNPFNFKTNSDNVFFRGLVVAFINALNDRIRYDVIVSPTETRPFSLDFYFSIVGDGRFIQDNFINMDNCKFDFADGNYDPIPRGVVSIAGIEMPEDSLTNNYVRIEYQKLVDGAMKTYSAQAIAVPLRVSFQVDIIVDILLDYFRIAQVAFSEFFKTIPFSFRYESIRIPARAMIPAPLPGEKPYSYSYSDDQRIKMGFTIEVETYLPVIDATTEFFKGNSIQTFSSSQEIYRQREQAKDNNPRLSTSSSIDPGSMTIVFDSYIDETKIMPGQYLTIKNTDSGKSFIITTDGPAQRTGNTVTVPIVDSDDLSIIYSRIADFSAMVLTSDEHFQVFEYVSSSSSVSDGNIKFNVDVPGVVNPEDEPNFFENVTEITVSGTDFNSNNLTKWMKSVYMTESQFSRFATIVNKTGDARVTFKILSVNNQTDSNGNVTSSIWSVQYVSGNGSITANDLCTIVYGSDDNFSIIVLDFWSNIPMPDGLNVNLRLFKDVSSTSINRSTM